MSQNKVNLNFFLFWLGFFPWAEQALQGIELQKNKEKNVEKLIYKILLIKCSYHLEACKTV